MLDINLSGSPVLHGIIDVGHSSVHVQVRIFTMMEMLFGLRRLHTASISLHGAENASRTILWRQAQLSKAFTALYA